MRILSFNITHDSSVCAINDGFIEFFCKEERLSGQKRDIHPFLSLNLYKSLNFGKVDHILYCTPTNTVSTLEFTFNNFARKLFNVSVENFSNLKHHDSHASIAFYNSGFEESLVFVIDRNGSVVFLNETPVARESESVYKFSYPDNIVPLYKNFWSYDGYENKRYLIKKQLQDLYPQSSIEVTNSFGVVKVYEAATTLIGEHPLENGKTMGLSSYGDEKDYPKLFDDSGKSVSNMFCHVDTNHMSNVSCFSGCEELITNKITEHNYKPYANKSKHVQVETQSETLRLIREYVNLTGIKNVCIVGGYGLNVVANNFYVKNLPNINFYFEPLADDTGISIGSAMLKYRSITKDKSIIVPKNNFYHYYDESSETTIDGNQVDLDYLGDVLVNQKSLAIFDGSPESGPRALGHRSILFDPRNKDAKNIINKIKKREWYRPFAGVILEEEFENYFETLGIKTSPYMTISFECKPETKLLTPGIVHVDNTCRIQTISDGFLYDLLKNFYDKTGCPMLLNTSFNLAGKPLVHTVEDALDTYANSNLDCLYFVKQNKLMEKV